MSIVGKIAGIPRFLKTTYRNAMDEVRREVQAGSVRPIFKGALLIGTIGYAMEYHNVGSTFIPFSNFLSCSDFLLSFFLSLLLSEYHAAEKRALLQEAMKNHHH